MMLGRLLDDLWDKVESVANCRGVGLVLLAVIPLGDDIGAKRLGHVQWMGHRHHATGIHRVHLIDESQNFGQLAGIPLNVILRDMQARKVGDVPNVSRFK